MDKEQNKELTKSVNFCNNRITKKGLRIVELL